MVASQSVTEFQFFPTPPTLVILLLSPYTRMGGNALEPSAGRGDIADKLQSMSQTRINISCCELSADLRAILRDKGHNVIGTNFLTLKTPYLFDLIVMNPPFADGAEHVLKAWELLADGGKLGVILPKTAVGKTLGKWDTLNKLIQQYGKVEQVGSAFAHAERRTQVDCVIVRLEKPAASRFDPFANSTFKPDSVDREEPEDRHLPAPRNMIRALVAQYDAAIRTLRTVYEAEKQLEQLVPKVNAYQDDFVPKPYHERIEKIKTAFWNQVFERTQIAKLTTSKFREQFYRDQQRLSRIEFSEENIYEVLSTFMENRDDIMGQCVMDVFNALTRYSRDNLVKDEQWATNKSWKLGKKVIIPYGVNFSSSPWSSSFSLSYKVSDLLNDLDKVIRMFGGQGETDTYEEMAAIANTLNNGNYQKELEVVNFKFRVYKKGTVHLFWKNTDALQAINRYAAEKRLFVLGSGN